MTSTRVETWQRTQQIMETNTSKPWDTFWSSEKNGVLAFQDNSKKKNVATNKYNMVMGINVDFDLFYYVLSGFTHQCGFH